MNTNVWHILLYNVKIWLFVSWDKYAIGQNDLPQPLPAVGLDELGSEQPKEVALEKNILILKNKSSIIRTEKKKGKKEGAKKKEERESFQNGFLQKGNISKIWNRQESSWRGDKEGEGPLAR